MTRRTTRSEAASAHVLPSQCHAQLSELPFALFTASAYASRLFQLASTFLPPWHPSGCGRLCAAGVL